MQRTAEPPVPVEGVPIHPSRDRPMFIPRLGYRQEDLVGTLSAHGARCTVASLYYAQTNPELAFVPSAEHLGLVLDPTTHVREKPFEKRAPTYRTQPWGACGDAFDPDRSPISETELEELSTGPIDLQRSRGATLILTSYHVSGLVGSRGRDLDLLLANAGIAHFRKERMEEPPEHAAINDKREIYATLAVNIDHLMTPSARSRLASAYVDLEADGLWIKILGFHEEASPERIEAGAAFLCELAEGPLPVVSDGAGQLHLGLLACNISASIGIADSQRFSYPRTWEPPPKTKNRKPSGRSRSAYHPTFMRSFRIGSDRAKRAFAISRCRCGHHQPAHPPNHKQVGDHTAVVRMREATDALDGDLDDRREWLLGRATKATWAEHDADIPKGNALSAIEALFTGWDRELDVAAVSS
jgi:hypothetical protein